jgi:adenylate cyclase
MVAREGSSGALARLRAAPGALAAALRSGRPGAKRPQAGLTAWGAALLVALASALVALALSVTAPVRLAENLFYDVRAALAARPAGAPIVIIKIDDESLAAMRDASDCRCLSPIDRVWLADVIAGVASRGASVIVVDYLLDTFRTPAEFDAFKARLADVTTPVIAAAAPGLLPGIDFPASDRMVFADARTLMKDTLDDVVRDYDPAPEGRRSLAAAALDALGLAAPQAPFPIVYRRAAGGGAENAGALAPSIAATMVSDLPDDFFAGKVVLIGRVTRSLTRDADQLLEDVHLTPLRFLAGHQGGTPGVEVHAHALDQMLVGDRYMRPVGAAGLLILLLAALGGALFGRSALGWRTILVMILGGLAAFAGIAFAALAIGRVMVDIATPILSFALAYLVTGRITATQLRADRALYSGTLNRYLAPQVITRIIEGREPVEIGATTRAITVLATDVEDFSVLVGACPPAQFAQIINAYFDGVIDILWKHEAMIDKLTGDGLIAFFGAPVDQPDHPRRAIDCARDIDAFAQAYRSQVGAEAGVRFGRTRIGLHTGEALVGNFGGQRRFNYTAYGEVVVIAARLEAANKQFDSRILASAETVRLAGVAQDTRDVGTVQLKGVAHPVGARVVA